VKIIISNTASAPIYEQIVTQIKGQIMSGELSQGDALPSMRLLAKELRISVITTKRAYEELEREGFITSVTGKGSFVASPNLDFIKEERLRSIEEDMKKIIVSANTCGLSLADLVEMLTLLYKGD
jgi:GntR family transcriptional regulator